MPLRHFRSAAAKDFNPPSLGKVSLTTGDITTTSVAPTFADATGMSVTITTKVSRCLVSVSASGKHSGTDTICVDLSIDGVRQGQALGLCFSDTAAQNRNMSFTFVTGVLSAGSHLFKLQFANGAAGTMTLYASTTTSPLIMSVIELPN